MRRRRSALTASLLMLTVTAAQDRYASDAAGRAARVDATWRLRRDDGQRIDLLSGLAPAKMHATETQRHRAPRFDGMAGIAGHRTDRDEWWI